MIQNEEDFYLMREI